jgi:AraC-like DNA-binding protein
MRQPSSFQCSLPTTEDLSASPLQVTNAGWEQIEPGQAYPREETMLYGFKWEDGRILPEFCLVWLKRGSGVLQVTKGNQTIPEKRAFFFRPGEWHRHRPDPAVGWTIYWVGFSGWLPDRWMLNDEFVLEGNLAVIRDPALFEAQFERLLRTVEEFPTVNSTSLSCHTAGLLSHLLHHGSERRDEFLVHDDESVNQAVKFIWNHHHSFIDVPEVVAHVGIGRRSLERRFADVLGRSILEEIQLCRLTRAKRLLEGSALPLKRIVHLAGLRSRHQLWILFKKHVGMSPEDYRQTFKEGN